MNESNQKDIQQSGEKLVGIGGWLALFIFVSKWINPPYAMLSILQTYFIVESANQYSPNEKMIYIVLLSVFTLAVTYLQFKYAKLVS